MLVILLDLPLLRPKAKAAPDATGPAPDLESGIDPLLADESLPPRKLPAREQAPSAAKPGQRRA